MYDSRFAVRVVFEIMGFIERLNHPKIKN